MIGRQMVGARVVITVTEELEEGWRTELKILTQWLPQGTARTFLPSNIAKEYLCRGSVSWRFSKQSCRWTGSWRPVGIMPAFYLPEQMLPESTVLCSLLHTLNADRMKMLTLMPVKSMVQWKNNNINVLKPSNTPSIFDELLWTRCIQWWLAGSYC